MYGHINISIKLGKSEYFHQVIVCDISPDGILGQDFMLEHVKKIDCEQYMLHFRPRICPANSRFMCVSNALYVR